MFETSYRLIFIIHTDKAMYYLSLLNDKKRRSKCLVLLPGEQKTFRLSSRTPRIPFNVLSLNKLSTKDRRKSA